MISLDQVILLEKKVESAVAKIQQLKAENDALRNKCSELTNALSAKTEQLSSFVNDQSQIEDGIRKALDRLNSIENSVLKAAAVKKQTIESDGSNKKTVIQQATFQDLKPVQQSVNQQKNIPDIYMEEPVEEVVEETYTPNPADEVFDSPISSFDQIYNNIPEEVPESNEMFSEENSDDFGNNSDEQTDLGFDIF